MSIKQPCLLKFNKQNYGIGCTEKLTYNATLKFAQNNEGLPNVTVTNTAEKVCLPRKLSHTDII